MYFVSGSNEAIISQEMFDQAQQLRKTRKRDPTLLHDTISRQIRCSCGARVRAKKINQKWYWCCCNHEERHECQITPIPEIQVQESFCRLYYKLKHQSIPILEHMFTNLRLIRNRRMLWSPDIVALNLPQMELYCEIGKIVCARSEKGAAVAAAEFLKEQYPDMTGFSPRNVRRMRDFWQLYGGMPELLGEALHLNWTQNVVIMEAELTAEEYRWYIRKAAESGLSKTDLLWMIASSAHLEIALGENEDTCYTVENDEFSEKNRHEGYPVYLPRQYLPQSHGRVRDEGLDTKGWAVVTISYRISSYQPGGDRQPNLSSGTAQTDRA